ESERVLIGVRLRTSRRVAEADSAVIKVPRHVCPAYAAVRASVDVARAEIQRHPIARVGEQIRVVTQLTEVNRGHAAFGPRGTAVGARFDVCVDEIVDETAVIDIYLLRIRRADRDSDIAPLGDVVLRAE